MLAAKALLRGYPSKALVCTVGTILLAVLMICLPDIALHLPAGVLRRAVDMQYYSSSDNVVYNHSEQSSVWHAGDNELKILQFGTELGLRRYYFYEIELEHVPQPDGRSVLTLDLYSPDGYDSRLQEIQIDLFKVSTNMFSGYLYTGGANVPKQGAFRLFSHDRIGELSMARLEISRSNSLYSIVSWLIKFSLFCLAVYGLYQLYRVNDALCIAVLIFLLSFWIALILPNHNLTRKPYMLDNSMYGIWGDTGWFVPTSLSMLGEGNADLDEFEDSLHVAKNIFSLTRVNGHTYNYFPIGMSLVILPFIGFVNAYTNNQWWLTELICSGILFALTNALFFLLLQVLTRFSRLKRSVLCTFVFALATTNLNTITKTLFSHGGLEVLLIIGLLGIAWGEYKKSGWSIILSGFPFALAYMTRPTASLFVVLFTLYIMTKHPESFISYLMVLGTVLLLFFIWSFCVYGHLLPPYYQASRLSMATYAEAWFGQMFSPNKGLLIFTPFYLFYVPALWRLSRKKKWSLELMIACAPIPFVLILAAFPHWWGGAGYGPRLFTDIAPFLVLTVSSVYVMDSTGRPKHWKQAVLAGLIAISLVIQLKGAVSYEAYLWSSTPGCDNDVDSHPERLWDWHDMQIFR